MELGAYKYRLRNEMSGNPFVGMAVDNYKDKIKNKSLEELEAELSYRVHNVPRQCGKSRTNMLIDMELLEMIMQKRKERLLTRIEESNYKFVYDRNNNLIIGPPQSILASNKKYK